MVANHRQDNPDRAGALEYHELTSAGAPRGKVFAKPDLDNGSSWTVTLSHELLEMWRPLDQLVRYGRLQQNLWLEVWDAVEADDLGVPVSDFVTPALWYVPTCTDRLDFKKHISKELELARGGYISILDPASGWIQITAKGDGGPRIVPGGRRQWRKLIRPAWRRSGV